MSFNGSGTFLINTAGQPVVAGTVISSTAFNALTADLATGLSTVITKDGQTTVTANIPMSTYKFTGLGVGSAATDSANLSQVQSTVTKLLTSVSGTDTITAVGAPVVAAYAAGQMFYFVATGDNTGAVTLNIDSLGAKAVTRDGSVALAAGDIKSGEVVVVVYDGTRFQVVSQLNSAGDARFANVSIASSLYVGGVSTFVGNAGFSANVSIASALSVGGVAAITGATTIGGNLTLNGGTANGVLYLNGSKVATSGSALVFDGTNFGVGGSGDPFGRFYGRSVGISSASSAFLEINAATGSSSGIDFGVNAARTAGITSNTTETNFTTLGATPILFGINGTEQMRLTSTGLGIGTSSPTDKLQVGAFSGNNVITVGAGTAGVSSVYFGDGTGADRYRGYIDYVHTSDRFEFGTSATTKATLDSSGNLGIGTSSPAAKLQVVSGNIRLDNNQGLEWGGGNNYIYGNETTDFVAIATNGSERARITSGGRFLLNTTSTVVSGDEICGMIGTSGIGVKCTGGSANFAASFWNDATSGDNVFVNFYTETGGTLRGTITYNRAGGLVAYNTTSDYRSKDIFGPVQNSGATIDALKVYEGQMKGASQSRPMLVAHEAQEHAPYAVTGEKDAVNEDGTPKYQQMDVSALVPLLLAEIQSLRARVAQLETK
jgi:hypothetical protein